MDYRKHYDKLIESRKNMDRKGIYLERHHIIPVCMGGSNSKENIILLTGREHFIAHWLLWRIYRTDKLANAFFAMTRRSNNQERSYSSRAYEEAKEAISKSARKRFLGIPKSEEQKEKMSLSAKGKTKSEKHRLNLSKALKGKKRSDEFKSKVSESMKSGGNPRARRVFARDVDYNLKHTFETITEAGEFFGVNRRIIERRIKANKKFKDLYFYNE